MGNTCGSCSFDNRGSEFDMEAKDKSLQPNTQKDNPPIRLEEPDVKTANVVVKQVKPQNTKAGKSHNHLQFNTEDKENNFEFQNKDMEEIIEKEILGEKEKDDYETQGHQEEEMLDASFDFLDPPTYD
jgi:hypothetical protein